MLTIAVLSSVITYNSYKLNKDLSNAQIKALESQKKINDSNLRYLEDLMSPDIYFVAIPKSQIDHRIGKFYGVEHSNFIKNKEIEFRINNRGKKSVNLIGIITYGSCIDYDEYSFLSMAELGFQNLKSGEQKSFTSSILDYEKINQNCEINFILKTIDGDFETKLIIK